MSNSDGQALLAILEQIQRGGATRAELVEETGLSRTTVGARLNELLAQQLVVEVQGEVSTGGRPPRMLRFNPGAGVVLAVDAGASRIALSVADLQGEPLAERSELRSIDAGPEETLAWIAAELGTMLKTLGRTTADVRAAGVGLPGSVEFSTGRPVSPHLMPGWDRFPVAETLKGKLGIAHVLVDSDANVMALGEARQHDPAEHVVLLKAGTGVHLGYVTQGTVQRGAQGAAGDIGHIRVPGHDDVRCWCGKSGCLEAVAGGTALAERLTAAGVACRGAAEVAAAVRDGHPDAIAAVKDAGRAIGFVLATVVNVLNPSRLVIAGDLSEARDFLLGAIRETVYREAGTLATVELEIGRAAAGDRAGLIGAATMALERALAPAAILAR